MFEFIKNLLNGKSVFPTRKSKVLKDLDISEDEFTDINDSELSATSVFDSNIGLSETSFDTVSEFVTELNNNDLTSYYYVKNIPLSETSFDTVTELNGGFVDSKNYNVLLDGVINDLTNMLKV